MQRTTKGSLRLCVCLRCSWLVSPFASSPLSPGYRRLDPWFILQWGREKKGESACERRNSQDHWEIIRWSGVVDLELNGIINQAKKQARCSYIYYLHVFHFRRCNQQIYVWAPDPCRWDLEAERPFRPLTLKVQSGISSARRFIFFLPDYHLHTMPSASKVISTTSRTSPTESCCCLPVL